MSETEMEKLYRKETGKSSWGNWGSPSCTDAEDEQGNLEVYVEGPTVDYIKWLETRASKSSKEAELPASDNNQMDAIAKLEEVKHKWDTETKCFPDKNFVDMMNIVDEVIASQQHH